MKRIALEQNSHSLSYFQQCPRRFYYSEIELLVPKEDYAPFKRGTAIGKALEIWYLAKKRGYTPTQLKRLELFLFQRIENSSAFLNDRARSAEDQDLSHRIAMRLKLYFDKYRYEPYKIISVEKGFSKVLFENELFYYTYSGKPDVVLDFGGSGIGPMDHKSESRQSDIEPFNNQFIGYLWGISGNFGMVNYIGIQKNDKDGEVLRRKSFCFSDRQIERWRLDTIEWYHLIAYAIKNRRFLRSWHCEGKYGTCLYHKICISGTPKAELIQIERNFKKLDEPYRSW